MAIRFFDEWERRDSNGRRVLEMHAWLGDDPPPPARPRRRAHDASVGAPGEMKPGAPVPNGETPVYRGSSDPDGDVPSTSGLPAASKRQSTEPPQFIDARSLRISGRDQRGRNWQALVYGPSGVEQPGVWPQLSPGDFEPAADALRDFAGSAGRNEVAGLGQLQRLLNLSYARRR
jgi:hypothetical protein